MALRVFKGLLNVPLILYQLVLRRLNCSQNNLRSHNSSLSSEHTMVFLDPNSEFISESFPKEGEVCRRNRTLLVPISALVGVSIDLIKHHDQKQLGGEKGLFQLTVPQYSSSLKGSQGRDLDAGVEPESMEESCILACFWGLPRLISFAPGITSPRSELSPLASIIDQEKCSKVCPHACLVGDLLSRGSLFLNDSSLCQLERTPVTIID